MPVIKISTADLRSRYKRHFEISLVLLLLFMIIAFKFSPNAKKFRTNTELLQELNQLDEILSTLQKPDTPPPLKTPQIVEVTLANEIEEIELQDVEINENEIMGSPELHSSKPSYEEEEKIFVAVEQMPEIIGGIETIQKKVYYTEIAKRS